MKHISSASLIFFCLSASASALDLTADPALTGAAPILSPSPSSPVSADGFDNTPPPAPATVMSRMFGAQLFTSQNAEGGAGIAFNPNYVIGLGDTIQVRLWGAFTYDGTLTVDPKGNIFLPNVGPLKVAGVTNSQLNTLVIMRVKEVYQANVNVYASLVQAQPVKVFVTGYVRTPGLYGGVASDSLLSYLSKAGGVDSERGSYVDITVVLIHLEYEKNREDIGLFGI